MNPRYAFYQAHCASRAASHPCAKLLHALRKVVREIKRSPPQLIYYAGDFQLRLYSDASFSLPTLTGRIGVLLTAEYAEGQHVPLAWKTMMLRKKVLSAFAAEAHALLEAIRLYRWHKTTIQTLFPGKRVEVMIDSQALYKAITSGLRKEVFLKELLDFITDQLNELNLILTWVERSRQRADQLTHI